MGERTFSSSRRLSLQVIYAFQRLMQLLIQEAEELKKLLDAFGSRLAHNADSAVNTVSTTVVESTTTA